MRVCASPRHAKTYLQSQDVSAGLAMTMSSCLSQVAQILRHQHFPFASKYLVLDTDGKPPSQRLSDPWQDEQLATVL